MNIFLEGQSCDEELVLLHFTDKVGFKRARRVVPFESFSISIPKLETVLFFTILVTEVIWFTSIPICECDRSTVGHPEEVSFIGQISARRPEMLVAKTCNKINVECLLELPFQIEQVLTPDATKHSIS